MADDDALHNELTGRERIASLPISRLMIERIDTVTDDNGHFETDDAVPFIIAALVSLEQLIREG